MRKPCGTVGKVLAGVLCIGLVIPGRAATVTLNTGQTYQTIEGIGAFHSLPRLYRQAGRFWVDRPDSYEMDKFIIQLGASIVRFELQPDAYPRQGEPYHWEVLSGTFRDMREMIARGTNRFILSVWSPPCWMKESGDCSGPREASADAGPLGNVLRADMYDAMAAYIADYCKTIKDSVGVEPYAISVQNEPYFHEPYNSCVYYENQLNDLVTRTRTALNNKGLTTRIFGPEHMFWNQANYYGLMLDNPGLYAWAVHGYSDGVNPDYGTATDWQNLYNTVNAKGKKLWMTETTGGFSTVMCARTLHTALYSGKISVWSWWAYADNLGTYVQTDGVNTAWNPGGTYWGTRHYARFVRPGAVMIGCTSDQSGLWASAYRNSDNTYAVVLVNTGTSATTVNLSGSGIPTTWQRYYSDGTNNCVHSGQVGSSGISVPGSGVVTLYSGSPVPVLPPDTIANSVPEPTPSNTIGELNVFGDDIIRVWFNGNSVTFPTDNGGSVVVPVRQGQNVVACYLVNGAWGGGMLSSMLLPGNDTMRTGPGWKFTYVQPPTGWQQIEFDDASWRPVVVLGYADMWPGFERWGMSAVNLYYQRARWLYCDTVMYFRKANISVSSTVQARIFGNNFRARLFVNGNQLGQELSCTGITNAPQSFGQIAAGTHTIALEVREINHDGNGVLLKFFGQNQSGQILFALDSTWKCWPDLVTGWNTTSFNDASWFNPEPDRITWMGSGPNNNQVAYVYPRRFWYRGTFTSQQSTEAVLTLSASKRSISISKVEYYNLRGQQISAAAARSMPNSMVVRRIVGPDGVERTMPKVMVK